MSTAVQERLTELWATPHTLYGLLSTVDHKKLGKRYIFTALAFLLVGGIEALVMRIQLTGALGVSGDTACADHETAKRMRNEAGLNPPGGMHADDITFPAVDGPSVYSHPFCANTYRDGKFLGQESPGTYDMENAPHSATRRKNGQPPTAPKK